MLRESQFEIGFSQQAFATDDAFALANKNVQRCVKVYLNHSTTSEKDTCNRLHFYHPHMYQVLISVRSVCLSDQIFEPQKLFI